MLTRVSNRNLVPKCSPLAETNQVANWRLVSPFLQVLVKSVGNVDISHYVLVISGVEKGNTVIRLSKLARGCETGDK